MRRIVRIVAEKEVSVPVLVPFKTGVSHNFNFFSIRGVTRHEKQPPEALH